MRVLARWTCCWTSNDVVASRILRREGLYDILIADMKTLVQIRNGEQSALSPEEKENFLLLRLGEIPSLIVALSGGADSAYLAWAANWAIDDRALSVTALYSGFSVSSRDMDVTSVQSLAVLDTF